MARKISKEIKKEYVYRYWLGEKPLELGKIMIDNGDVFSSLNTAGKNVFRWQKLFSYKDFKKEKNNFKKEKIKKENFKGKGNIYFKIKNKYNSQNSITFLCKKYKVSNAGYYAWMNKLNKKDLPIFRGKDGRYDQNLLDLIETSFYENRKAYGFTRLKVYLERNYGIHRNIKTIKRYYDYLGLKSKVRRKRKNRELKNVKFYKENLINREFKSDNPNEKWFSDISYIPLKGKDKFGYLSIIIDGYNNEIVDAKFSLIADSNLVMDNLKSAISKNNNIKNLIIHTDHGIQYTSKIFQNYLNDSNIQHSMSRIGNSLDNRPAEYLFSILKQEYLDWTFLKKFREVKKDIEFAKNHYNYFRFQSCLNNKTPMEFK